MASSPFTDGLAHLHVTTGSELAEVFVIDRAFALVERAIGTLDKSVPQGVYKIKARLGDVATEDWYVVNGDLRLDLADKLAITSPVPLEGTSQADQQQMRPAAEESRRIVMSAGAGAQIFLCTRRWTEPDSDEPSDDRASTLPALSLHRPNGEKLVDLQASGRGDEAGLGDPMLGATVEVDPGNYMVRWGDQSGGTAEQTVVAVRDWQTQVFVLEDQGEELVAGDGVLLPARRERISVLMARDEFRSNDAQLQLADQARIALASERRIASEVINDSLFGKFENPMLGLFGAHLMLLSEDAKLEAAAADQRGAAAGLQLAPPVSFNQGLFDQVVWNLADLLGWDHPDVTALGTKASNKPIAELPPVEVPPMLWRSWLLLIEASNDRPDLLPVSTWRRTVKLLSMRPFLVWSPEVDAAAVEEWQRGVAEVVQAPTPEPQHDLEDVFGPPSGAEPGEPVAGAEDPRRQLSMQLLAPRAAIDELAGE
jgi:hypothetical protein